MTEHLCEGIIQQSPSRSGRVTTEWGPGMTAVAQRRRAGVAFLRDSEERR
jgi:hypothetical protein